MGESSPTKPIVSGQAEFLPTLKMQKTVFPFAYRHTKAKKKKHNPNAESTSVPEVKYSLHMHHNA